MLISLGPLLDPILRDLHLPLAKGGLLSLAFFLGRVAGVVLLNVVLARVPLRVTLILAAWVQAAGLAAAGLLAPGLWPLFGALFVTGLTAVVPNALAGVWVGAHVRKDTERAMLLVLAFFALGVVVAPLMIGAALSWGATWRWVFVGEAIFSAVVGAALMASPLADVRGRENLRLPQLREMAGFHPRLLGIMETVLGVWLAKYLVDRFAASPAVAALSVTLFWAGITVGRYVTVPLTRRIHPPLLLAVFAVVQCVFTVGLLLSPGLASSEACAFLTGIGGSVCFPLIAGYTSRFPGWYSGVAYSGMMLAGTSGSVVFSYVTGPLAGALGLRAALGLSAALPVFLVVLSVWLGRVSGRHPAPAL
jgi:fucose permease